MQPVTVRAAASALGVTPRRIHQLINAGLIAATRFGRVWQIDPKQLSKPALRNRRGPGRPRKGTP